MKYHKVDRVTAIGLCAYMRQVDLSLHRASGHPRHVLTDYLRDHSEVPGVVCDFYWDDIDLDTNDRLSPIPRLALLRLMNQFRHDPLVNASLFPLANDVMRKIARYLDDGQALIGREVSDLRLTLAYVNEELWRTLGPAYAGACGCVEHFYQNCHKQFQSIDEIAGGKWPL
ncbi:hypothetical protein LC55x_4991 [Lysobacter capsici]|nr:hypothetical protein LC55x_4991 [Lysobacter capsici]